MIQIIDNYLLKTHKDYQENPLLKRFHNLFITISVPVILVCVFFFFFPLTIISFIQAFNSLLDASVLGIVVNALFPFYFTVNVIRNYRALRSRPQIFRVKQQRNLLLRTTFDMLVSIFYFALSQASPASGLLNWIDDFKSVAVVGIYNGLNFLTFYKAYQGKLSKD